MKKKILLFASILTLVSCGPTPAEFDNALKAGIANAEKLVNSYDRKVLDALALNRPDTITPMTEAALSGLVKEQKRISDLSVPSDGEHLKKAAEDYIEALINFVKAQNLYAGYSDALPDNEVQTIDKTCQDALATVKLLHSKLIDYQKAFAKDKGVL
ncbi:MAG: hypothetical protein LBR34_06740 [Prevotella sp.]|jgi:hypothetical protein|nr:hypothetical protein [Prevotella sp.]